MNNRFRPIHAGRLYRLARHLKKGKLGHPIFDIRIVNTTERLNHQHFGERGCALGELPIVFPKTFYFDRKGALASWLNALIPDCYFFALTKAEKLHLFCAECQDVNTFGGKPLGSDATPKQVAQNILDFLSVKGYTQAELDYFIHIT